MTCDQVAIIKNGRVVRQGTLDLLLSATATVELRVDGLTDTLIRDMKACRRRRSSATALC